MAIPQQHICTIEPVSGSMFRHAVLLAKPGIIFGNLISVAGGFFLAARGGIDLTLLMNTMFGISLVMASACVFNNIIDRDIDQKMERTRNRALALGLISPQAASLPACVLGLAGFSLLLLTTTIWAAGMAFMGFVVYLLFYSLYLKRNSIHGTLIGSLSGAAPPLVGYCAVSNHFDMGALILLLIFSLWQMPHAYAIGIFRQNDYASASVPVLPVTRGIDVTRQHIILYILAFMLANLMLTFTGYVGASYMAVATILGGFWLYIAWAGYKAGEGVRWAKQLFVLSLVIVIAINLMMSIDFVSVSEMARIAR